MQVRVMEQGLGEVIAVERLRRRGEVVYIAAG